MNTTEEGGLLFANDGTILKTSMQIWEINLHQNTRLKGTAWTEIMIQTTVFGLPKKNSKTIDEIIASLSLGVKPKHFTNGPIILASIMEPFGPDLKCFTGRSKRRLLKVRGRRVENERR